MCILAYNSKQNDGVKYSLLRYIYFLICGSIVNVWYILIGYYFFEFNLRGFFSICLSLSDAVFPTFWCMKSFLVACIISFINGKRKAEYWKVLLEIAAFSVAGYDWVAICLMGTLVASLYDNKVCNKIFGNRIIRIIICIFIFIVIKRPENLLTYYIDGLCMALLLLSLNHSKRVKVLIEKCRLSLILGKYTMPVFMLHNGVYYMLGSRLFELNIYDGVRYPIVFICNFVICFGIVLVIAVPMQILLNYVLKSFGVLYDRINNKGEFKSTVVIKDNTIFNADGKKDLG